MLKPPSCTFVHGNVYMIPNDFMHLSQYMGTHVQNLNQEQPARVYGYANAMGPNVYITLLYHFCFYFVNMHDILTALLLVKRKRPRNYARPGHGNVVEALYLFRICTCTCEIKIQSFLQQFYLPVLFLIFEH